VRHFEIVHGIQPRTIVHESLHRQNLKNTEEDGEAKLWRIVFIRCINRTPKFYFLEVKPLEQFPKLLSFCLYKLQIGPELGVCQSERITISVGDEKRGLYTVTVQPVSFLHYPVKVGDKKWQGLLMEASAAYRCDQNYSKNPGAKIPMRIAWRGPTLLLQSQFHV